MNNKTEEILKNLNPQQKEAVLAKNGPVLIVAGAGSGKTRVIAHKIAYLINEGVEPSNILAITFTNKAAGEMNSRIIELISKITPSKSAKQSFPTIGTFHAVCLSILRKEIGLIGYKPNFVIYDEDDQKSLIKDIMKDQNVDTRQFQPASVKEKISLAKNELIDSITYKETAKNFFEEKVSLIYREYQDKLKKMNALDFDDLIFLTVIIFQKYPAILEKYQEKFKYMLVDEYQDTNTVQYAFVNLLAQKYKNICVVGDVDQAIYSWRGADFRNILNFEKDYPNAKIVMLEENYRSTKNILDAAQNVIQKNIFRKDKKLVTQNSGGNKINIVLVESEQEEANFIAKEILILKNENKKLRFGNFCVLYRTNAQSRAIEEGLLKYNLPYKIIGGLRFYERKEIKDLLAYLKFFQNNSDFVSLKRIINVPPRNLAFTKNFKNSDFEKIFESREAPGELKSSQKIYLNAFLNLIQEISDHQKKYPLTRFLKFLVEKINYEEYLRENFENWEERIENIKELLTVTSLYDALEPKIALEKFLENTALIQGQDDIKENEDFINLMTIHSAKGLEFSVVFIAGLEEGIFPHSRSSVSQDQEEEERRLCYVAITRAKNDLYLISSRKRRIFGSTVVNPPSRFLLDVPQDLIQVVEFSERNIENGDAVDKIFENDEERIEYDF